MYHNVEKAHKKGASVSTMNEATHKETNTNPENPEKTTWTLEEAETKLKEELEKFQDAGEKILDQYENIAKIQKEIDETKQNIAELKVNENTKDKYSSPQSVFEEFKQKYREKYSSEYKDKVKDEMKKEKLSAKISSISIIILGSLIIYTILYINKGLNNQIIAVFEDYRPWISLVIFIIYIFIFFIYKKNAKEKNKLKQSKGLDIFVLLFTLISLFVLTCTIHQEAMKQVVDYMEKNHFFSHISNIFSTMILLIILDCCDNHYKLTLAKEKKYASLCIQEVLGKRNINIDLIRVLISFKDEIQDGLICELYSSNVIKIFGFLGMVSLLSTSILNFIIDIIKQKQNGIESVLVVIFFVGLIIFIFIQFHKAVHDKDLYIEALKDMEFKEALEISK